MRRSILFVVLSLLVLNVIARASHQSFTSSDESVRMSHTQTEDSQHAHEVVKMTTSQLTLNLSGISFPPPAPQGDNLNLSSLSIPRVGKCGPGYILKGTNCRLVNLLLMQNLDAQNLIIGDYNLEELKNKQQEFVKENPGFEPIKCDGDKPFLGRQGCISCAEPHPYFNLLTFKCSKCPKGSSYVAEIRNCQKVAVNYVSNFQNKNFLVLPDKNLTQYKEEVEALKLKDPSLETCPQDKPFSTGAECISCPEDKPLFFLPAQSCTRCAEGSTFNPETNLCTAEPQVITVPVEPKPQQPKPQEPKPEQPKPQQPKPEEPKPQEPKPVEDPNKKKNVTIDTQTTEEQDDSAGKQKWTVVKGLANIFGWNREASNDLIDRARDIQSSNLGSQNSDKRTVTSVTTETRKTNKSIRKEVDSEDQPQDQNDSNGKSTTKTKTEIRKVQVEPIEEKEE